MKTHLLRGVLLLAFASGCGSIQDETLAPEEAGTEGQALEEDNGLTANGLAFNGLAFNGLAFNGLAFNGLSSANFNTWFGQDPANAALFMKYLVRCAVPAGQTRSYTRGPTTYVWAGGLGLAPAWAGGQPATLEEQETVSACLGALTNKYARSVMVSVLGTTAQGTPLATTAQENASYTLREGCFFGNLFNGDGLFVGNDQGLFNYNQSSLRACALGGPNACPPLQFIGSCHALCMHDATGSAFTRCYQQGHLYHALTTRLRPQDVYTCGDGICQFPEVCGNNDYGDACKSDCGKCK